MPLLRRLLPYIIASLAVVLVGCSSAYALSTYQTIQGGTGTSSPSGILYGDNGATTHLNTVKIGANCTFSGGTLNCSGGGSGTVSTSTSESSGNLAYWTSNSATPALLGQVGTTSPTLGLGLSGTLTTINNTAQSLSIATSSLYTGTTGQVPYFDATNDLVGTSSISIATNQNVTIASKLTVSSGGINITGASTFGTGGVSLTQGATVGASGLSLVAGGNGINANNVFLYWPTTASPSKVLGIMGTPGDVYGFVTDPLTMVTNIGSITGSAQTPTLQTDAALTVIGTTTVNTANAFIVQDSTNKNLLVVDDTGTTTAANGFNITAGCYAINGTCLSTGGGSGTVTNIATTYPLLGGPITTTGTLSLAFGTTTANAWSQLQQFANATSTLFSATTAWLGTLNLTNALTTANGGTGSTTLTGLLKGNGTGSLLTAVGDTDYQKPITLTTTGTSGAATFSGDTLNIPQYAGTTYTATYPVTLTSTAFGLAFGTTTSNTWGGTQTFTNPIVDGTLSGLIAGKSGTTYAAATSTLALGSGLSYSGTLGAFVGGVAGTLSITNPLPAVGASSTALISDASAAHWEQLLFNEIGGLLNLATQVTGILPAGNGGTGATALSSFFSVVSNVLHANLHRSFSYATSTAWTGTTTIPLESGYGETWNSVRCFTDAGTLGVDFFHSTSHLNYIPTASTTNNVNTFTTNNTITSGDQVKVQIGTPASSPTVINCTVYDTE